MKFEELKKVLFKYGAFHDCLVNSIEIKLELNCINLYLDDINKCIINKKEQQKAILFFNDVQEFKIDVFTSQGNIAIENMNIAFDNNYAKANISWETDIIPKDTQQSQDWHIICKYVDLKLLN